MAIEKQKLILISGIILGVMAIVMTKMYLDQQQLAVQARAKAALEAARSNQTSVLVAKQEIAQGVVIDPTMFDVSIVPNKFVQPQAVTSLDRIAGMVTVAPISKGEQISLSKLMADRRSRSADLAGVTPSGKRAITIVADSIASLSGMVRPGDYVDVLAIVPIPMQGVDGRVTAQTSVIPLFQNVLVLAVGQNTGGLVAQSGRYSEASSSSSSTTGNVLITVALGPQEANLIAFVQEQGKLRLVMRSPADARIEPMAPASWESFFNYVMPKPEMSPMVDTNEYIEVLRGLSKERVALSQ